MMRTPGLTLVELMVIVAIISVLAGLVLANWGPAEKRGQDGQIISNLSQIRTEMVSCRNASVAKSYSDCHASTTDNNVYELMQQCDNLNGDKRATLYNGGSAYCAEIQLNSGRWRCIDSGMTSQKYASDPDCSNGNYHCESDGNQSTI